MSLLELAIWIVFGAIAVGCAVVADHKGWKPGYALAAGLGVLIVAGAIWFNFNLVTGGQVGVAMKGNNISTFTGLKITPLGTKVVKFDRALNLDLNIELNDQGVPSDRTVQILPRDGSTILLDSRAVLALDSLCEPGKPRRCVSQNDKDQIASLAVQFRKDGQSGLERYAVGKLRERANLVAGTFADADTLVNQERAKFIGDFDAGIRTGLSDAGFDVTLLVVEQIVPSQATMDRINAIVTQRAETQKKAEEARTAEEVAKAQKVQADTAAYAVSAAAKADAEGIKERGAAYAANPSAAQVDIARAYGEKGNAVVVTNGQAEVRPIVTTGSAQSGQ